MRSIIHLIPNIFLVMMGVDMVSANRMASKITVSAMGGLATN